LKNHRARSVPKGPADDKDSGGYIYFNAHVEITYVTLTIRRAEGDIRSTAKRIRNEAKASSATVPKPTSPRGAVPAPNAVFISYSHADNQSSDPQRRWLDRFIEFLQPLVSQENFTLCSDQDIQIGDQWHRRIQAQLNAAKAVVLLVSPAFLASAHIRNSELPVILKNAADQGVRIFPILISPRCSRRQSTNTRIQRPDRRNLLYRPFRPLARYRKRWSKWMRANRIASC